MKLDFQKSMLVNPMKRIFIGQTTPVDKHPSFTNVSCQLVDECTMSTALCVNKIDAIMKERKVNVVKALIELMNIYSIAKVSEFKLVMAINSKHSYVPIKVTMVLKDMCVKNGSLSAKFSNVSVNIAKNDRCAANKYFNQSIYDTNWYPVQASINGKVWKNVDTSKNLWHRRSEVLEEWRDYYTAKYHAGILPEDPRHIFVLLAPFDEFSSDYITEGARDIRVERFEQGFEDAESIYEGIMKNQYAIIREDMIEDPLNPLTNVLSVFTCIKVGVMKHNCEICNGVMLEDDVCEIPLKDCMIYDMGEWKLIKNVELSWDYGVKLDDVSIKPYDTVNPLQESIVRLEFKEVYGDILKYELSIVDNIDNFDVTTETDASLNIPNSGCNICG